MTDDLNTDLASGDPEDVPILPAVPRVAIVIPTYNSTRYLSSTVESVIGQTFKAWELVLFDDGSTDGTVELSRNLAGLDPRIKTSIGSHGGVAAARNAGLRHADSPAEFVTFLDHDDTWEPEALETLVAALDAHPESPAAHALAKATDIDGRQFDDDDLAEHMSNRREWRQGALVEVPVSSPTPFAAMVLENWVVTPGASLIRRSAFTAIGGFEPATVPSDDWDLNLRLARRGNLAFVDRVVLNWRRHPDAQSNLVKGYRWADLTVRRRTIDARDNSPEQRKVALHQLRVDCQCGRSAALKAVRAVQARTALVELTFVLLGYVNYYRYRLFGVRAKRPEMP